MTKASVVHYKHQIAINNKKKAHLTRQNEKLESMIAAAGGNTSVPAKPEPAKTLENLGVDEIKAILNERGIKFHHKAGRIKLLELLHDTNNK